MLCNVPACQRHPFQFNTLRMPFFRTSNTTLNDLIDTHEAHGLLVRTQAQFLLLFYIYHNLEPLKQYLTNLELREFGRHCHSTQQVYPSRLGHAKAISRNLGVIVFHRTIHALDDRLRPVHAAKRILKPKATISLN